MTRPVRFAVLVSVLTAWSASAQGPRWEIGGGYSGVNYEQLPSFNAGWIGSAAKGVRWTAQIAWRR